MDSNTVIAALVGALTLGAIYFHIKRFSYWSSRGIPGPTPWPFVGTSIYYFFGNKVIVDDNWREQYGRVYGIYSGYQPILRVTDNELVKHIYIKDFSSFTDRFNTNIYGRQIKKWVFFSEGPHWNNQRPLISPMFTSSRLKSMFKQMNECVDRLGEEVRRRIDSSNAEVRGSSGKDKKQSVPQAQVSKDELMSLALDVIGQSFFSLKLDTYRDKTSEFFRRAFAFARFDVPHFILWSLIPSAICKYFELDLTTYSKYEYFDKLSQKVIDERRSKQQGQQQPAKKVDFIQALIDAKLPDGGVKERVFSADDDQDAHYNANISSSQLEQTYMDQTKSVKFRSFTDLEIRAQMSFFFLAGFETTSSSMTFCLYELGHQQALQEELHQEVKRRMSGKPIGAIIEHEDLMSLHRLDAFVSETLRLYSPVTEHNRMVTNPAGVRLPTQPPLYLPQGMIISTPGYVLQRDADYWPKPLEFDIDRFSPERRSEIKSGSYMPFGLGPRNCAGLRFALMTIKLSLAKLLLEYKIHVGPKSAAYPPAFNQHAFFLQITHSEFRFAPRATIV